MSGPCSHCGKPHESKHRYCRSCQAIYMQGWRAGRLAKMTSIEERLARIEAHLGVEGSHVPQVADRT